MLITCFGCSAHQPDKTVTADALSLMNKVNTSNFPHTDDASRIWYDINPTSFADSDHNGSGDLKGIEPYLVYLNDQDASRIDNDLNITGLLLTNLAARDSSGNILGYDQMRPEIGTIDDLQSLISAAHEQGMKVMIRFDLSPLSSESTLFRSLIDALKELTEEQSLEDLDPALRDSFVLSEEQQENYIHVPETRFYYLPANESGSPELNTDGEAFRQAVLSGIDMVMQAGADGLYIPDAIAAANGDYEKAASLVYWINDQVKAYNEQDFILVSGSQDFKEQIPGLSFTDQSYKGAEGAVATAVTGSMSARELGEYLISHDNDAYILNNDENTMDLIKSESRQAQFKMALALHLWMSHQVFVLAGDEIGLPAETTALITDAFSTEEKDRKSDQNKDETNDNAQDVRLGFGDLAGQLKDGNSILRFVQQAIFLRDSYNAISSGQMSLESDLTTDQVLTIRKVTSGSEVVLVFNLSDSQQSVNTESIQIQSLPAELGGILLTSDQTVDFEDNLLVLPPYSAAILK